MKKVLINLSISLGSILFLFILFEIGFRIVESIQKARAGDKIWAVYDPDLGYRLRPNFADFNSDGLRDDPVDSVKTKFRLLLLGDSVPFYGDDIHDTFPGHLESILNSDSSLTPTEVINAGVKGYTNYQELVYLKKYGLKFKPDLVGVSFILNDLHKFLHQFEVKDGKIVGETYQFTKEAVKGVQSPLYQIARKSHFLVWLRRKLSIFESLVEFETKKGFTFDYRPDFNTAWQDKPWVDIERQMAEMVQLGKENGFRVFLVAFPFGEQLREDYLAKDYEYTTKPQRKLKEICQKLDIPYLDLFNDIDRKKHLLADEIHLTKEGRILVARKIAEFLKENQLIPKRQSTAE